MKYLVISFLVFSSLNSISISFASVKESSAAKDAFLSLIKEGRYTGMDGCHIVVTSTDNDLVVEGISKEGNSVAVRIIGKNDFRFNVGRGQFIQSNHYQSEADVTEYVDEMLKTNATSSNNTTINISIESNEVHNRTTNSRIVDCELIINK